MPMHRAILACLLTLVALPSGARAQGERVMIGDDIYVGADEDLREAVCIGCSIRVDGKVREAVAIGGSIEVNGEVERQAVAIGGSIEVNGTVGREVVSIAGGLDIAGEVGDNAVSILGRIELAPGARIGRDVVSVLGEVDGLDQATVAGSVQQAGGVNPELLKSILLAAIALVLILAVAVWPLLTFILISVLGPRRVSVLHETVTQRAGMCLLLGFGTWIASIFLPMVLFWLPPADFVIGAAFLAVAAVGYTGVSYWLGRVFVRSRSMRATGVLGAILATIIQLIPIIGWFIVTPVFAFLALGSAILSGFGTSVDWMVPRSEVDPVPRPAVR
jgi:hypothetical protein